MRLRSNADEIEKAVLGLGSGMRKQTLKAAALAGITHVEATAKQLSPFLTGTLRRSHRKAIKISTPNLASAVLGPTVEYAAAVHFGRKGRGGNPWLFDAFDRRERGMGDVIAKTIWKLAVKNAGGIR